MNHRELDRIREVHHTLLARLDDPPSLTDLSRLAGINRNKLNRGFKQLYGNTAFNVLRDARLSKARVLLQETDLNLSEVAFSDVPRFIEMSPKIPKIFSGSAKCKI